jgi:hypothetical protein
MVAAGVLCWLGQNAPAQEASILLADDAHRPHVVISWPTRDGKTVTLEGERAWRSPGDKSLLGKNVECYAALGGTRLEKGAGHPKGAIVRVGLYKADAKKPFFEDIADDATITITLDHIVMNQPATPRLKTGLMHMKYMQSDLVACGLDGTARNLLNTSDPEDPLAKVVVPGTARPGSLDGQGKDHGAFQARTEADGSVTVTVTFPYVLLRHIKDPSQRTNPGGFFEPQHFHVEMELIPKAVADAEKAAEKDQGRAAPAGSESRPSATRAKP